MNRFVAAFPRALASVALGATLVVGGAWVAEPFLHAPEIGVMNLDSREHNDLLELIDSSIFSDVQWRPAEASARLAVVLTIMVLVTVLSRGASFWRRTHSPVATQLIRARVTRKEVILLSVTLLLIVICAGYPATLVRRTLRQAAIEAMPLEEPLPNFDIPPPLTPAERESMGKEIPPEHPKDLWLMTRVGILPSPVDYCPVHGKLLEYESIPMHPELPGHMVREGFPFGQLVFAKRIGIHLEDWPAERCADCVTLHERYLGKSQAELRYRAKHQKWGWNF
jgi:hypothetical protein